MEDTEMVDVSPSSSKGLVIPQLDDIGKAEERKLRVKITKSYPTYLKVQKLLDEHKEKFGLDFALGEEKEDEEDELKLFCDFTDRREKTGTTPEQLPKGVNGCDVCESRNSNHFNYKRKLCAGCVTTKSKTKNLILKCNGVFQLVNDCPLVGNLLHKCVRCRVAKMTEKVPEYYDGKNIAQSTVPPGPTLPGRYANLMDLREVGSHWFIHDNFERKDTGAFLIRAINFSEKNFRELASFFIRVELDDVHLDNAYGVQQLMRKMTSLPAYHNKELFLVHVDQEILPWSPHDPNIAISCYYSMMVVDYLLNPRLNADPRQSMRTEVLMSTIKAKFITSENINKYLAKRGSTTGGWIPTDELGIPLLVPPTKAERVSSYVPLQNYKGCVYAYIFESGKVEVGSYHRSHARPHTDFQRSALSKYIEDTPSDRYFRVILRHIQQERDKDNEILRKLYEGIFQVIFKFAELSQIPLPYLNLPIQPTSTANTTTWPGLDHNNLPSNPIVLLNDKIEGANLTIDQYNEMQNISRLLFGRHIQDNWSYENDPLQITVPEPQQG